MQGAPALEIFQDVYREYFKGVAPGEHGYNLPSGIVGKAKARQVLWCLDEGHKVVKRRHVAAAESLQICRDESRLRLHVRYRIISAVCWDVSSEYMGTACDIDGSALGLTEATAGVYQEFCTLYVEPPPGAAVEPSFDPELYSKMRNMTEAIAVDSAENEVVASRDLCRNMHSFAPHCKFLLRDSAHATRRVLSRAWKACAVKRSSNL